MSSTSKSTLTLSKSISKSNNNVISVLEKPVVKYTVLIAITLLVIFIEKIDTKILEVFDLDMFKIVYALFIAYTACFDPIYAIILTTFMIMSIQELHSRRSKNAIQSHSLLGMGLKKNINHKVKPAFIPSHIDSNNHIQSSQSVVYESMPNKDILINDKLEYDLINKHSLQKTPDNNDTLIAEYDYYEDPAFKTITNNLKEKNMLNKNEFYVTDDDLTKAQNNTQQGVNQNTSMKAFTSNILNIQGLPNGYDPKVKNIGFM